MGNLREKIDAEWENVSSVLRELEKIKDKPKKTVVELAGIGTFLYNIYNGVENTIKQILKHKNLQIPTGASWHRDLLTAAVDNGILSQALKEKLAQYLAFRHFFSHAYGLLLKEEDLMILVGNIFTVWPTFKKEIQAFLSEAE